MVWEDWSNLKILNLYEEVVVTGFKPYILTIYKLQLENRIIHLFESLFIFMIPNEHIDPHFKKCKCTDAKTCQKTFSCFQLSVSKPLKILKIQSALLSSGSHRLWEQQNYHINFLHMLQSGKFKSGFNDQWHQVNCISESEFQI